MATHISLQLYAVNDALSKDLDGGIARLAEIGFDTVEAFDFVSRPAELKAVFDRHGITARTGHAIFLSTEVATPDGILGDIPAPAVTFAAAKELGLDVVIDPFVPADRWATRADVEDTAARLNAAAKEAAAYGLAVGYHNHDHEFRTQIDGVTAYEVFAGLLDEGVRLELDLYWATAAGVDVAALLERLGERVIAVHVKDGPMREGISTADLPQDQSPAGQGDVPLAAAFAAAPALQYAVIEFDHFEGDIFDGVKQSFDWLTANLGAEVSA
ncbi:sugar phosphate isomerase/epimerase family protein [Frondihabitans cladoniiphilus]|uniref:Sugar phosphate isomerase/epimerase n=1 Tax=Frondihabitans cladoniiphilus TaxID=715785 RepID=A0ABP8W014_9MICO